MPASIAVDHMGDVYVADGTGKQVVKLSVDRQSSTMVGSGWSNPAGVTVDASGNAFVVDAGSSQVMEISASGATSAIGSGWNAPRGVSVDASGNIYIADTGNNRVMMVPFGGGAPVSIGTGLSAPAAVAVDSSSNIYIADTGNHRIVKVVGTTQSTIGTGWSAPVGVAVDTVGNLLVADTGLNAVEKIPAGSSSYTPVGSGLNAARGVTADLQGNIYIADTDNARVLEVQINSVNLGIIVAGQASTAFPLNFTFAVATTVGSVGVLTQGSTGLDFQDAGSSTCIAKAYAAAATCTLNISFKPRAPGGRSGAAVIYDASSPNNKPLLTIYLSGTGIGAALAITPATQTALTINSAAVTATPEGVAVDAMGNVYLADAANGQVVRIAAGSGTQTTVGSGLKTPYGVALDGAGNLLIADYGHGYVTRVPNENGVLTTADQTTLGTGLSVVRGIATDALGNIYAIDYNNNRIVEIPSSGAAQINFGGTGTLYKPRGVAVDTTGNVIVGDAANSRVTMFAPGGGTATTDLIAPNASVAGHTVTAPFGVAVDAAGNLYVADSSNNRILLIPRKNGALSIADAVAYGPGLSVPADVKVDSSGNIYIADTGNARGMLLNTGSATLNFGLCSTGVATAPVTESFFNIGNTALNFGTPAYKLTGSSADFSVQSPAVGGCVFTAALATGLGCSLNVIFTPQANGSRAASFAFTSAPVLPVAPQMSFTGSGTTATSALTLSTTTTTVNYGQSVSVKASVSGAGAGSTTPSGTVTFTLNGVALAPVALDATGTASCSLTTLVPGLNMVTASYSGDATYPLANSGTLSIGMKPQDFRGLYAFSNINSADAANPSFAGANLIFYWADIQPTKTGTPNWAPVTAAAQPWISAGKKVILRFSTSGQVGFGGSAGNGTPAWVYQDGARSVTESDGSVIPVYWDTAYQTDYANFVKLLAQQYDGVPWVAFVEAGIGMGGETLPDTESTNANRNALWAAVGYTDPIYLNCVETLLNINRQYFLSTPVAVMLDSTFLGIGGVAGENYYNDLGNWLESQTLPYWLQYNGLTNTSGLPSVFTQAPVRAVEQRNSAVNSGDSIASDVQQGFAVNGQYQLIYTSDVDNSANQATFQAAAALANSGTSATVTSLGSTASTLQTGQSVTLTATVTSALAGLTGLVDFSDGNNVIGSATLNGSGIASFTTTALGAGTHTITATNTGNGVYLASTSTAVTVLVQTSTTLTLSVTPATSVFGTSVMLKAVVAPQSGSTVPSGTVTFTLDGVAQSPVTLTSSVAILNLTSPSVGGHSFTAVYNGDASDASSASGAAMSFTVTAAPDFTFTSGVNALTVTAGHSASMTLTVAPTNGFNQVVTFSCSGLPMLSTCTFAPASVTPSGTAAATTLTIETTAASAANSCKTKLFYAMLLPGLLCFFIVGRARGAAARWLGCALVCVMLGGFTGCGAGSSSGANTSPGTTKGTSTLVVTATSVSATHSLSVTLTVQ
jgi:sugar lactone lactonase YvrE